MLPFISHKCDYVDTGDASETHEKACCFTSDFFKEPSKNPIKIILSSSIANIELNNIIKC